MLNYITDNCVAWWIFCWFAEISSLFIFCVFFIPKKLKKKMYFKIHIQVRGEGESAWWIVGLCIGYLVSPYQVLYLFLRLDPKFKRPRDKSLGIDCSIFHRLKTVYRVSINIFNTPQSSSNRGLRVGRFKNGPVIVRRK